MNKIQQIVGWASDNRGLNLDGKELNVLEFELLLTEKIEALFIADVSQRSELLPKITPHLEGHEPTCDCDPCDLLRKIFGNCG